MSHAEPMAIALPGKPMKCTAHNARGEACQAWAVKGMAICSHHGFTQRGRNAARRRLAVYTMGQLMEKHMHATEEPGEALMTELYRSCVLVETFQALVNALEIEGEEGIALSYGRDLHVWVEALADERDRKARLAKMALDAGLAERAIKVAEGQAVLLAQLVTAVLDDPALALTIDQRMTARHLVAERARASLPTVVEAQAE